MGLKDDGMGGTETEQLFYPFHLVVLCAGRGGAVSGQ